jgi:sarcosine oxidase gamma subunit
LHVAPGRWLLPDADAQAVAAAVTDGAVAIDVEGKWRCFELRGAHASSLLSAGVNIAVILEGRDCAAVPLFDCPTVIARGPRDAGFDLYVHASYAASLRAALHMALQRMARS